MRRTCNKIPKLHIKKGDVVKVLSGDKDMKGKQGQVMQVMPLKQKAIVEGLNMVTKHVKPNQQYPNGEIVRIEAPIHVSKLQLINPKDGKPTRIGRKKTENGWVRYSKRTGDIIS